MGNSWNWKQAVSFFLLFIPAFLFYALQKNAFSLSESNPLKTPAHWVQIGYDTFAKQIQDSLNTYFYLVDTNKKNQELTTQNAKLASQMQLLEEYRSENIRLRELFKFKQELARETLAARIISKDILPNQNSFTIDKGTADGVERMQGVISADGVVGYTIEVQEHSSRVLLLSNQNASVDALVQRTRARGVVSGVSTRAYQLSYLMRRQDADANDVVVTSGRQGFFPKGFQIGTIQGVSSSPTGVSYQAKIEPSVKVESLEHVLVIISKKKLAEIGKVE